MVAEDGLCRHFGLVVGQHLASVHAQPGCRGSAKIGGGDATHDTSDKYGMTFAANPIQKAHSENSVRASVMSCRATVEHYSK